MASSPSSAEETLKALQSDPLVKAATSYIRTYMSNYDASHSFDHIQRVVRLAIHIYLSLLPSQSAPLDARAIILSALLHDVGDRKYISQGEDPTTMISSLLLSLSCPAPLASKVQEICLAVSYSTEVKDPAKTMEVLARHPELGVVQDADRIDALGAVGMGRLFTFGGSKTKRSMQEGMDHVDEKLLRLEGMCKTEPGRRMARERTQRLRVFKEWWGEETGFGVESWEFEG
jgi:uncharacterized protein